MYILKTVKSISICICYALDEHNILSHFCMSVLQLVDITVSDQLTKATVEFNFDRNISWRVPVFVTEYSRIVIIIKLVTNFWALWLI